MHMANVHLATPPAISRGSPIHVIAGLLLIIGGMTADGRVLAAGFWSGLQIMQEVHRRQRQFPYVYEEHSIVLVDSTGQRDTRQARLYSRVEDNGELKILYIFESPAEVRGVTLMAVRGADGKTATSIYLPAFGDRFIKSSLTGSNGNFLGTDFTIEDLIAEDLGAYRYVRRDDEKAEGLDYFVIDVYPSGQGPVSGHPLKRHYVRQDCFVITRTDYFDNQGRLYKQLRKYDLKKLGDEIWGANMILMEDKKLQQQSLIKVDRRVFSKDYVPEEMFSRDWVLTNYPPLQQPQTAGGDTAVNAREDGKTDAGKSSATATGQKQP